MLCYNYSINGSKLQLYIMIMIMHSKSDLPEPVHHSLWKQYLQQQFGSNISQPDNHDEEPLTFCCWSSYQSCVAAVVCTTNTAHRLQQFKWLTHLTERKFNSSKPAENDQRVAQYITCLVWLTVLGSYSASICLLVLFGTLTTMHAGS